MIMNPSNSKIVHAVGWFLMLLLPACRQEESKKDGAANSAPNPQIFTNTDLSHGYVRRGGAIHFLGGGTTGTGENATRIDTPSPKVLQTFVDSKIGTFKTSEGLDVASFEALSERYSRDRSRVYYNIISPGVFLVIVLPKADPETFELVAGHLVKDKNHVWYYDRIQAGVDPATVESIAGSRVYKDKDSVHYGYQTISGADVSKFESVGGGYFADGDRVYWGPDPVPGADPIDFENLKESFIGKDKCRVYRSGVPLPGLDVATLEVLVHDPAGYQILSDKNGIHLNDKTFPRSKPGKIEKIDRFTFKAGELIHLISSYQNTPVTLFKEDGQLLAETPYYPDGQQNPSGHLIAEVTADGLRNLRTTPLPGASEAPPAPGWQIDVFKRPDFVRRMFDAGEWIE
jgi:hypothetical protein